METTVTHFFFWGGGGGGYEVRYVLRENNEYQSHITVVSKLQECVSVLNIRQGMYDSYNLQFSSFLIVCFVLDNLILILVKLTFNFAER